jgi:hypothetical protein
MSAWFIVGVVAFFAGTMLNRSLSAKAWTTLDEGQRASYTATFARLRWSVIAPPVVLIGLFFLGMKFLPGRLALLSALFWVGLLLFVALNGVLTVRSLARLGVPVATRRFWALGQAARWGGLLALFCGFFLQMRV